MVSVKFLLIFVTFVLSMGIFGERQACAQSAIAERIIQCRRDSLSHNHLTTYKAMRLAVGTELWINGHSVSLRKDENITTLCRNHLEESSAISNLNGPVVTKAPAIQARQPTTTTGDNYEIPAQQHQFDIYLEWMTFVSMSGLMLGLGTLLILTRKWRKTKKAYLRIHHDLVAARKSVAWKVEHIRMMEQRVEETQRHLEAVLSGEAGVAYEKIPLVLSTTLFPSKKGYIEHGQDIEDHTIYLKVRESFGGTIRARLSASLNSEEETDTWEFTYPDDRINLGLILTQSSPIGLRQTLEENRQLEVPYFIKLGEKCFINALPTIHEIRERHLMKVRSEQELCDS